MVFEDGEWPIIFVFLDEGFLSWHDLDQQVNHEMLKVHFLLTVRRYLYQ